MPKRMKPSTKLVPSRLRNRSPEDWEEIITTQCYAYQIIKVACTVWWDFCHKWETSTWFREHLDAYTVDSEIPKEELEYCLLAIGYTKKMVRNKLKVKWLDSYEERMKKKDPEYTRKRVGSYNR